jgi:SAM-dependent methyltransferase
MQAQPVSRDSLVRRHFDEANRLYVDVHREKAGIIARQRLRQYQETVPRGLPVRLLDAGCGAGFFTDLFLGAYPEAMCVGADASIGMLSRNLPAEGKHLVAADARSIPFLPGSFDVVNIDTVLHHVLDAKGYAATIATITETLRGLRDLLSPGGVLLVREIYHEYRGYREFGTRTIHFASTLRLPAPCLALLRRCGIQTAGVGVCFLSRRQWDAVFAGAGLEVAAAAGYPWPKSALRWFGFAASGEMHYVLRAANRPTRKEDCLAQGRVNRCAAI